MEVLSGLYEESKANGRRNCSDYTQALGHVGCMMVKEGLPEHSIDGSSSVTQAARDSFNALRRGGVTMGISEQREGKGKNAAGSQRAEYRLGRLGGLESFWTAVLKPVMLHVLIGLHRAPGGLLVPLQMGRPR
jgi:hypothetical protein